MKNLWWCIKDHIKHDVIDDIVNQCEKKELKNGTLGVTSGNVDVGIRSVNSCFLNKNEFADLHTLVLDLAHDANKAAFGFDIASVQNIQYLQYDSKQQGKYDWHTDTFWVNPEIPLYQRKISVVIQLSNPKEYKGGEFQIDDPEWKDFSEFSKSKGSVILFPSFLLHRVTPVTEGTRRSLVAWIDGLNFR